MLRRLIMRCRDLVTLFVAVCLLALATPATAPAEESPPPAKEKPDALPELVADDSRMVTFRAPALGVKVPEGKARMSIYFSGNRRWCTYPDDRVVRNPTDDTRKASPRDREVYTFGYKFSIAAVDRGDPSATLMLFESPLVRTASFRQAAKLGRGKTPPPVGPSLGGAGRRKNPQDAPNAMVPYWDEKYRCARVAEQFDFDLDPGVYDVYLAFDLLNRSGGWVHRSTGYLTGIEVEEKRITRVDGVVNITPDKGRQVDLLSSVLLPQTEAAASDH